VVVLYYTTLKMGVEWAGNALLDFEISYFAIDFLVKLCFSLSFEV